MLSSLHRLLSRQVDVRWISFICWTLVLVSVFIVNVNSIAANDFWWHLKTGEYLWQNWSIPTQDIFSHTANGRAWVDHEWLAQVVFYGWYRIGGLEAVVYFTALMAVLSLMIVGLIMRQKGVPQILAQGVIFFGAILLAADIKPRPQLFYFFLWISLIWVLNRYDQGFKKVLWLVPIIFLAWINFHASVHLPLILIGSWLGAKIIVDLKKKKKTQEIISKNRGLVLATGLGLFFTLVNPNGIKPFKVIVSSFQVVFQPLIQGNFQFEEVSLEIIEWQSPLLHPQYWRLELIVFFYGCWCLSLLLSWGKNSQSDKTQQLIVALPLVLFSMWVGKFLPLAFFLVLPFLGNNLKIILARFKLTFLSRLSVRLVVVAALIFLAFGFHYLYGRPVQAVWNNFPQQAVSFIRTNRLPGRMYNFYDWGGYLIWELYPEYRVFIDGRVEMYIPEVAKDSYVIQSGSKKWEEVLEKYQVNFLVVPPRLVYPDLAVSENWMMVYFDNLAAIFVRNDPVNQEIIKQFGYRHIQPFLPSYKIEKGEEEAAIAEYQRALDMTPDLIKAHYDLGIIYLERGETSNAEAHFRQAGMRPIR